MGAGGGSSFSEVDRSSFLVALAINALVGDTCLLAEVSEPTAAVAAALCFPSVGNFSSGKSLSSSSLNSYSSALLLDLPVKNYCKHLLQAFFSPILRQKPQQIFRKLEFRREILEFRKIFLSLDKKIEVLY